MAKTPIAAIASDFAEVWSLLKARNIVPAAHSGASLQMARTVHARTYSLILWRFRLKKLPPHSRIFIDEIASDAIQILPQVMMGYSKTAKLLIRGVLENALRHVYFSDHPVEFARMNREGKWYLTADQLCDYAKNHHEFLKTEQKFDAIAQATSLYSSLSAGVHGRRVGDLETRTSLEKIIYEPASAASDAEALRKCTQAANFIIAIFQHEQMSGFLLEDQRLILRTLPQTARQVWKEHEPDSYQ